MSWCWLSDTVGAGTYIVLFVLVVVLVDVFTDYTFNDTGCTID